MTFVAFHRGDTDHQAANQDEPKQGDEQLLRQGHRRRLVPAAVLVLLATAARASRISSDLHIT
jgi:hypothetical protein